MLKPIIPQPLLLHAAWPSVDQLATRDVFRVEVDAWGDITVSCLIERLDAHEAQRLASILNRQAVRRAGFGVMPESLAICENFAREILEWQTGAC